MHGSTALELTAFLALGVGAQWMAARFRQPAILLLLTFGIVAGPLLGLLDPDAILPGDLIPALASLSVAVILFEGGLTLKLDEARSVGPIVARLVSVGTLVTWGIGAAGARWILGLDAGLATLLGAILVLSGPTVVAPMLRELKLRGPAGPILKWEGIVIDPVGALLASLVVRVLVGSGSTGAVLVALLETVVAGGILGWLAAWVLVWALRHEKVADKMQVPVTLALVVGIYTLANEVAAEAGLVAVTLLGFRLANQHDVSIHHILSFKENLADLLIGGLFVVLAARVDPAALTRHLFPEGVLYLLLLIVVARPVAVWISTVGAGMDWRQRAMLAAVFPRGIVAAAVTPVFAYELVATGREDARELVPLTYLVIIGAAACYALLSPLVARRLAVAEPNPQGLLLVGAHAVARAIARAVQDAGFRVVLIDTNRRNVANARLDGLDAHYGNILAEGALEELDLSGVGRMLALTPNDEVNSLAAVQGADLFGRSQVFQLAQEAKRGPSGEATARHLRGRTAFAPEVTYDLLRDRILGGDVVKRTHLTADFGLEDLERTYGASLLPLFRVPTKGRLDVLTAGDELEVKPGATLVSLVDTRESPG